MGFPLRMDEFGGGFIYAMPDGCCLWALWRDSTIAIRCSIRTSRFSISSGIRSCAPLLDGGQLVRYGAKALPEGGWHTIPKLYTSGALIAGDAAGFLNSLRLKGMHLAMRTGMLAADTAFDAVSAGDASASALKAYDDRVNASAVRRELYPVRNVHQSFSYGLLAGVAYSGLSLVTRGWWFKDPMPAHAGYARMQTLSEFYQDGAPDPGSTVNPVKIDRRLTFDRLTNVHFSGTRHDEDQPSHLSCTTPRSAGPAAARNMGTHALGSVRPTSTRWSTRGRRASGCRSTPRTACTARRATSWIRTRSSTGCRPKAAEDRSTKACSER